LIEWGTSPAGAGRLKPCYGLARPLIESRFQRLRILRRFESRAARL